MEDIQRIVRRCQDGHLDAFDILFNHYRHRAFDLACIIIGDSLAAEDVVQDVFLVVFQKIHNFRGDSSFDTWLTAIIVNECRMYQRKQNIRQIFSLEQLSPSRLLGLSRREMDVPDTVHRNQRRKTLWDMVDQLPDRLRLPIILRFRYGYSCRDIGNILELQTSTIYQQLYEGRRKLEQMQRKQESEMKSFKMESVS